MIEIHLHVRIWYKFYSGSLLLKRCKHSQQNKLFQNDIMTIDKQKALRCDCVCSVEDGELEVEVSGISLHLLFNVFVFGGFYLFFLIFYTLLSTSCNVVMLGSLLRGHCAATNIGDSLSSTETSIA